MKNRLQNGTFQIPKIVTVIDIGMHSVRDRRDGSESAVEPKETKKEKRGTVYERIGESNSPGRFGHRMDRSILQTEKTVLDGKFCEMQKIYCLSSYIPTLKSF